MIKVGDRVFPIINMGRLGTVVSQKFVESKTWLVGGTHSHVRHLTVEHDDGTVEIYTSDQLMREQ